MRLERLILRNWCMVQSRDIEFHPGMNVLLGPNGSGKSNTMNAVLFALTGDYSRNAGTKAENICQAQPEGPASVRLIFVHDNMRFDVTRGLIGVTSTLAVSDMQGAPVESIRGEQKVTKRLNELLHVSSDILTDYVFVGQGKMFEPFDPSITPAARAVAFQQLFGLSRLELLWDALGGQLNSFPVIMVPDMAPYEAEYQRALDALTVSDNQLHGLLDIQNWQPQQDPDVGIVTRAQATPGLLQAQASHQGSRRNALGQWWSTRTTYMASLGQMAMIRTALEQITPMVAQSQQFLQAIQNQQSAQQEYDQAKALADSAERAVADLVNAPNLPPDGEAQTVAGLTERIRVVEQELAVDQEIRNRMGRLGDRCPTCGQAVGDSVHAQLEQTTVRIDSNNKSLVILRQLRDRWQQYETETARRLQQHSVLETRRQSAIQRLQAADQRRQALQVTPEEATWAEKVRTDHQNLQRAQDQLQGSIAPQEQSLRSLKAMIRGTRATLRQLRNDLAAAPTPAEAEAAQQRVLVKQNRFRQYTEVAAQHNANQQHFTRAEQARQQVLELQHTAARNQQVRTRLENLRQVLHRDNLPKVLLQQRLAAAGIDTNEALEVFGCPFRLAPREDRLSYRASFFDGRDQPIERLSGGEKVITALAFRIAVNARFAGALGLLCLDEPTVYLDADNVRCLEPALARLRQHAQTTGLQCVLITHEDVGQLFDHVINLP